MLKAEDNEILTRVGPGTLMGDAAAPVLDPGLPVGRDPRARQSPGPGAAARREPGRVPRHPGPGRPGAGELPAPRRVAVLRAQRGRVAALRLPRVGVRRRRQLRRHAQRAGPVLREGPDEVLPRPRVGRDRLDLHGPARDHDPVPRLRHRGTAAGRSGRPPRPSPPATGCRRWRATSTPPTSPTCTSGTASTTSPTTARTSPATRPTRCRGSSGGTTAPPDSRSTTPGSATATPGSAPPPTATPTCGSPPTSSRTPRWSPAFPGVSGRGSSSP